MSLCMPHPVRILGICHNRIATYTTGAHLRASSPFPAPCVVPMLQVYSPFILLSRTILANLNEHIISLRHISLDCSYSLCLRCSIMPEVLDAPQETITSSPSIAVISPEEKPILPHEKGTFYKGMPGGPGRPKGMKNAQTALLKSAPRLAKAYIKEALKGNATLLVDSRKWIMPTDDDRQPVGNPSSVVIMFMPATPQPVDISAKLVDTPLEMCNNLPVINAVSP